MTFRTAYDVRADHLDARARRARAAETRRLEELERDARYAARLARNRGTCTACIVGAVDEPCGCAVYGDHGPAYMPRNA